ncbi:5'-methylthioadenosine/S-adenosylhomocysteine nucleosidase [Actinoplanes utahensis]|uniref:5'-methylthioadenosine/S-adenosylhomocysteine nucleosidase family protein n=1 Tax=Actinoplanes utahensis TaxID=1869 RepID=UPI00068E25B0|nr:5'-methylthioadenosine/S-adenosylhomocysteine nucleosidase [Actinoplanes utahensis]GIF31540.1 purine phosphorylase [Actinoplanes utahensis]
MTPHLSKPSPVLFLTALDLEYEAVIDTLTDLRRSPSIAGTRFKIGSLPGGSGDAVIVVTGKGNAASAVIAERAIREFEPAAVLFVGVAGALRPEVALGDVVVASHVYAYHGAAERPGGARSRPRVWDIDHGIEQAAHELGRRYERERRAHPSGQIPKIRFGPIASGEVLHDAQESATLTWIRQHYEDALAIEMEAAGLAKAGQLNKAPVAVVRAISDRADGTKTVTDRDAWQDRAIRNAAVFATELATEIALDQQSPANAGRAAGASGTVTTHGGSHGAVAETIHGGVHNTWRPS